MMKSWKTVTVLVLLVCFAFLLVGRDQDRKKEELPCRVQVKGLEALRDLDIRIRGLDGLQALENIRVDLSGLKALECLDDLEIRLEGLEALDNLDIRLEGLEALEDLDIRLEGLEDLEIRLEGLAEEINRSVMDSLEGVFDFLEDFDWDEDILP